jgi:hypothetical protein
MSVHFHVHRDKFTNKRIIAQMQLNAYIRNLLIKQHSLWTIVLVALSA